jgi:hypothetical protein
MRDRGVTLASIEQSTGARVAAGVGLAILAAIGFGFTSRRCTPPARPTSGGRH